MQTLAGAPNLVIQAAKYRPFSLSLSQFLTAPMVQEETHEAQYQLATKSWGSTTGQKRSSCRCYHPGRQCGVGGLM